MMKIDKQLLANNKWNFEKEIKVPGLNELSYYTHDYKDFHMTITFGIANSNREVCLHIDNQDFETIASADIDTTEQFNMMMKVIGCDYELN